MAKKRINSIKKGKRGELEVANLLNDFYKIDKKSDSSFKRVPQSGAVATIHKSALSESEAQVFVGDIIAPNWWPYIIEVKNVARVDLYKIFTTGKCEWDAQLKEEKSNLKMAKKSGVILVFKGTRKDWLVMLDKDTFPKIKFCPRIELENGRIIVPLQHLLNITLSNLQH